MSATENKTYGVYHHCGSKCDTVGRGLSKEEAIEMCAEMNEAEENGRGHYYTTDANDCETCGKQPCQCESEQD